MYPDHDEEQSEETDWIMGLLGVDIFKLYLPVAISGDTTTYKSTFYPIEMERARLSQVPEQ